MPLLYIIDYEQIERLLSSGEMATEVRPVDYIESVMVMQSTRVLER